MVEGARLESVYRGNSIGGSNPSLSASFNLSTESRALSDAIVCDIVYRPLETPLLRAAAARGLRTVDGLGMLMHQAVPSFESFFGVRPTVTGALRNVLEEALRG